MVLESLMDAGITLVIISALAYYMKLTDKTRGFNWLAAAGVLLLFAGLLSVEKVANTVGVGQSTISIRNTATGIFLVAGVVIALIGTILVGYKLLREM